jgi:DNA-directed RNA polymerase specialized sigma24 family protein
MLDGLVLPPELQGITPEEALLMQRSDVRLSAFLERVGLKRLTPELSTGIFMLALEAEDAVHEAAAARQAATLETDANRRRPDTEELRAFVLDTGERLDLRLRLVARLALFDGLSNAKTAAALEISPATVRRHLQRLRAIVRCNRLGRSHTHASRESR